MSRDAPASVALAVLCVALAFKAPGDLTPAPSRKVAPDFTLHDSKGVPVRLSDYKGSVVLLDFWATWCHGCKEEIPWYIEFQKKYKAKLFSALGVAVDDDGWKAVRPFLAEHPINYPIVVGEWANMSKTFGFESLPVTLLIDRDGKIADVHAGMVDREGFEKEIQALLKESSATTPAR